MIKDGNVRITVSLPADLVQSAKDVAAAEGYIFSFWLAKLIRQYLEEV